MGSSFDKFFIKDASEYGRFLSEKKSGCSECSVNSASRYEYKDGIYLKKDSSQNNEAGIVFSGSILFDGAIYKAYSKTNDYDKLLSNLKDVLSDSDLTVGQLGTLVADEFYYTGEFRPHLYEAENVINNAPIEFIDAVKEVGFDAFMLSNENNLNLGSKGIESTLAELRKRNIINTGLFEDEKSKRFLLFEINGIKVAMLSYSIDFSLEESLSDFGKSVLVNKYSKSRLASDVSSAKKAGAECIITSIDWGKSIYDKERRQISSDIIQSGVDVLVGSLDYVKKIDFITKSDTRRSPVICSLGSLTSGEKCDNLIVKLKLTKVDGLVYTDLEYLPCHIFEEYKGDKFVNVPVTCEVNSDKRSEMNTSKDSLIKIAGKNYSGLGFSNHSVKLSKIHEILGMDYNCKFDKVFSGICTPDFQKENSVAVLYDKEHGSMTIDEAYENAIIAINNGAELIVTPIDLGERFTQIVVDDIEEAYIKLANCYRKMYSKVKVNHIIKSEDCSNSFSMINEILESRLNLSNASSVLSIDEETEVYVSEISPNEKEFVRADYVLSPNNCVRCDGLIVTREENRECGLENAIYYSIDNSLSDYYATDIKTEDGVIKYTLNNKGTKEEVELITSKEFDVFNAVMNSVEAFIIAELNKIDRKDIISALKRYRFVEVRCSKEEYDGVNFNINLKCDSPNEMVYCLQKLKYNNSDGKKIALISDANYSAELTSRECEIIAENILSSKADLALFFGDRVVQIYSKLKEIANDGIQLSHFEKIEELKDSFRNSISKGDTVLTIGNYKYAIANLMNELFGVLLDCIEVETVPYKRSHEGWIYKDLIFTASLFGRSIDSGNVKLPSIIHGVNIRNIEKNAFNSNNTIETLEIPNGYLNIMEKAFYKNSNLSSVKIPSSMKIIGKNAFYNCKNLSSIDISEGVYSIKENAFSGCTSLTSITLPKSVSEIKGNIFNNISSIEVGVYDNSYAHKYLRRAKYDNILIKIL